MLCLAEVPAEHDEVRDGGDAVRAAVRFGPLLPSRLPMASRKISPKARVTMAR